MRLTVALFSIFVFFCVGYLIYNRSEPSFRVLDYSAMRNIALVNDGRVMPFDTYARKVAYAFTGTETPQGMHPIEFVLGLVRNEDPLSESVFRIRHPELKAKLNVSPMVLYTSFAHVSAQESFADLQKQYNEKTDNKIKLSSMDQAFEKLLEQVHMMANLIQGESLTFFPVKDDKFTDWASVVSLEGAHDKQGLKMYEGFQQMLSGNFYKKQEEFDKGAEKVREVIQTQIPSYYEKFQQKMELEMDYNQYKPFRISWIIYVVGSIVSVLGIVLSRTVLHQMALMFMVLGFFAHTYGLGLRVVILDRPPVGNMYESVVFVGWAAILFFFTIRKKEHADVLTLCALLAASLTMIMADLLPMSSELGMLEAVLRSNYWLTIHVLIIVSSYGAFALAAALGHFYFARFFYLGTTKDSLLRAVSKSNYRAIQIGVILLGAGTILGGVWANESWGRFWGWDPKETWALISFLGYLAFLHGRKAGWFADFGLAVGSLIGFLLILMTWYGVNFVLGTGLHSYGFGSGGTHYAAGFTVFELIILAIVGYKYKSLQAAVPTSSTDHSMV